MSREQLAFVRYEKNSLGETVVVLKNFNGELQRWVRKAFKQRLVNLTAGGWPHGVTEAALKGWPREEQEEKK